MPGTSIAGKDYIPDKALKYIPIVIKEVDTVLPGFPLPPYFLALAEHESCVSLKSSRCWSPTSRLKTKREEGAGLFQLTRTWRNGKTRFDTLSDLVKQHPKQLGDLSWRNVYDRPDLQIKAMLFLYKSNYSKISKKGVPLITDRLAFSDMAYNGGYGRVLKDRRRCGLSKGCNPSIYFNNVEKYCTASKKKLYGNRSACDINRHHVRDVLTKRIKKYTEYYLNNLPSTK